MKVFPENRRRQRFRHQSLFGFILVDLGGGGGVRWGGSITMSQIYRRVDESIYRYESGGGSFVADLEFDGVGFVTNYPGVWQAAATK